VPTNKLCGPVACIAQRVETQHRNFWTVLGHAKQALLARCRRSHEGASTRV
jgi:hypothetical protein